MPGARTDQRRERGLTGTGPQGHRRSSNKGRHKQDSHQRSGHRRGLRRWYVVFSDMAEKLDVQGTAVKLRSPWGAFFPLADHSRYLLPRLRGCVDEADLSVVEG